jgi:hypothetical protein
MNRERIENGMGRGIRKEDRIIINKKCKKVKKVGRKKNGMERNKGGNDERVFEE